MAQSTAHEVSRTVNRTPFAHHSADLTYGGTVDVSVVIGTEYSASTTRHYHRPGHLDIVF